LFVVTSASVEYGDEVYRYTINLSHQNSVKQSVKASFVTLCLNNNNNNNNNNHDNVYGAVIMT